MTETDASFEYFFDPLCGWCYAAAPALQALHRAVGARLRLMPVGLFMGEGARPLSPSFAEYAWSNDQRIQTLTGQPFSPAYRQNILSAPGIRFDSGPATKALIALGQRDPALEPAFLHALQVRRYQDGADTARPAVLADIAATVAAAAGLTLDVSAFAAALEEDAVLVYDTDRRITASRQAMRTLSGNGVPQLRVTHAGQAHTVNGAPLYSGAEGIFAHLRALGLPV